jgi:hypothetical protein
MGMSASLFVAIPFAALAIVLLLCFVGCDVVFGLDEINNFTKYTPSILAEPELRAYWPLGEAAGTATATDLKGGHDGTYLSQMLPYDPSIPSSAAAPGTLALGQAGIVSGDTVPPHDLAAAQTTCIEVNGGYVSVPFDPELNPAGADGGFTIEAWVRVGWTAADPAATRVIMISFDTAAGPKGFALLASSINTWQGLVGTGTVVNAALGPDILFDTTNHILLTYDGTDLRLFVNGSQSTTVQTVYQPSTESRLFIGVGGPQLAEPRFPWVGKIQCVAVYNEALPLNKVIEHYHHGNGAHVSPS